MHNEIVIKDRWWQRQTNDIDSCSVHGRAPFEMIRRDLDPRRILCQPMIGCDCRHGLVQQLRQWVCTLKAGDKVLIYRCGLDPRMGVVRRVIAQGAFIHEESEIPLPVVQLEDESFFMSNGSQIVHRSCVPDLMRPIEAEDIARIERRDLASKIAKRDFSALSAEKLRAIDQILNAR